MINSNYGPILHRFRDTATYWLKIANFHTPVLFDATLPILPFEFRGAVRHGKTRVMGLPCGVSFMILASTVFVQSTRVTDR